MNENPLFKLFLLACFVFINLNVIIGMYGMVGEAIELKNKWFCIFVSFWFVFFCLFAILSVVIISLDIYSVL